MTEAKTPITRAAAEAKLVAHWLTTYTPKQLLETSEPRWDRLRNYEYEGMLAKDFGGEWVISEWCPFDGVFCAWSDACPVADLDKLLAVYEREADDFRARGLNPDYLAAYVRTKRDQR